MGQHLIRWKKGDYITLGKAVSQFNRKINELQKEETRTYLPELIDYKDIKENITTRNELNRIINSLRRFKKEGEEELTKWEIKELRIQKSIKKRRLKAELKELEKPLESGFSMVQMGSQRARKIVAELKNLDQLEYKKGYDFKRQKQNLKSTGTSDYQMKRSITYKKNYIENMKKYSHLKNYEILKNKMESFVNPFDFYEYVKDKELIKDLTYQSDEYYTQEEFNEFLKDWGLEIDESTENYEEIKVKKYNYSLIDKDGTVIAEANSLSTLRNIAKQYKGTTWIRDNSYF